jgi:Flp pilus assembly protein TadG
VVEFALSSLLFLTLVFGTIDVGRLVFMRTMFAGAVREAARQASITPSNTAEIAAAAARRSPSLTLSTSNFTITCTNWTTNLTISCAPTSVKELDLITVCGSYTFTAVATRLVGRSTIAATECVKSSVH